MEPIDANWGFDRGQPLDRHYIEAFLARHADLITGHVLEVQAPWYTGMFGTAVTGSDVLDITPSNAGATIIADLATPNSLPTARFDCAVVTQTLQFVHDLDGAVTNLWQSLRPGGSLLISVPTVSRVDPKLADVESWRLTPRGLFRVLEENCSGGEVHVDGYGNILVSTGFLYGLVTTDFRPDELSYHDPSFPTGACAFARKPPEPTASPQLAATS